MSSRAFTPWFEDTETRLVEPKRSSSLFLSLLSAVASHYGRSIRGSTKFPQRWQEFTKVDQNELLYPLHLDLFLVQLVFPPRPLQSHRSPYLQLVLLQNSNNFQTTYLTRSSKEFTASRLLSRSPPSFCPVDSYPSPSNHSILRYTPTLPVNVSNSSQR